MIVMKEYLHYSCVVMSDPVMSKNVDIQENKQWCHLFNSDR